MFNVFFTQISDFNLVRIRKAQTQSLQWFTLPNKVGICSLFNSMIFISGCGLRTVVFPVSVFYNILPLAMKLLSQKTVSLKTLFFSYLTVFPFIIHKTMESYCIKRFKTPWPHSPVNFQTLSLVFAGGHDLSALIFCHIQLKYYNKISPNRKLESNRNLLFRVLNVDKFYFRV